MICYIGLGSNLGDRLENIRRAVDLFKTFPGVSILRVSAVYETSAVWIQTPQQPDYLIWVAEVETMIAPSGSLGAPRRNRAGAGAQKDWNPRGRGLSISTFFIAAR
jgi:2-amino-4-hydroxy-6-hydroxymethyldihydropteridine diphosphokinase